MDKLYRHIEQFYPDMYTLAVPYVLIGLFVLILLLAVFKKWKLAIFLSICTIVLNIWSETFAMHLCHLFAYEKEDSDIRIMTFNINASSKDFDQRYEKIYQAIKESESDVVMINEHNGNVGIVSKFDSLLLQQYPYSSKDSIKGFDNIFISKKPLKKIKLISITPKKKMLLATIDDNQDKDIHLLACHLSSNNYIETGKVEVDTIRSKTGAQIYKRALMSGYEQRREVADSIYKYALNNINTDRLIILGDMNDICGSYTLRKIESIGLKDAWWSKGFGIGCTRDVRFLHFRLDHILVGKEFIIKHVYIPETGNLSDHRPLVVTI